jgi:hypothetical protein
MSILQRARGLPIYDMIVRAVKEADAKLRTQARTCGEPRYHHRAMKMTVYAMSVSPLVFEYGVHDNAQVVVIRRIHRLTSSTN